MSEWKVGDKVRLIGISWGGIVPSDDGLSVGAIAIVDEVDEEGVAMAKGWEVSDYDGAPLTGDWATERVGDAEAFLASVREMGLKLGLAGGATEGNAPVTVKRSDISLNESRETPLFTTAPSRTWWEAELSGNLSTGESVCMERVGATASNALAALEQAISDEGWVIEGGDD